MNILEELAKYAVKTPKKEAKKELWELDINAARALVKISLIKKKKVVHVVDGQVEIDVKFSRKRLSLEPLGADVIKLKAPEEEAEHVMNLIRQAIDGGSFDQQIRVAQLSLKPETSGVPAVIGA